MKTCAYCGIENPKTKDHIPPKNLFGKPLPADLITVPCCNDCHKDTSKDDEYFRSAVASWEALDGIPLIETLRDTVCRSLERKEAAGFAKNIVNSISETPTFTKSGIYTGNKSRMEIDYHRLNSVLERITRGLFFKETGGIVQKNMSVETKIFTAGNEQLVQTLQRYGIWHWRTFAGGQFGYAYIPDGSSSTWLLEIFGKFSAIGRIRPNPES